MILNIKNMYLTDPIIKPRRATWEIKRGMRVFIDDSGILQVRKRWKRGLMLIGHVIEYNSPYDAIIEIFNPVLKR